MCRYVLNLCFHKHNINPLLWKTTITKHLCWFISADFTYTILNSATWGCCTGAPAGSTGFFSDKFHRLCTFTEVSDACAQARLFCDNDASCQGYSWKTIQTTQGTFCFASTASECPGNALGNAVGTQTGDIDTNYSCFCVPSVSIGNQIFCSPCNVKIVSSN